MSSIIKKAVGPFDTKAPRLAGGMGGMGAKQSPFMQLRRATMACLLWEDVFYASGKSGAENISNLIAQCTPDDVALLAEETRVVQKLRHVPLYIAVEMCKLPTHRPYVGKLLPKICTRPDQLTEFLALYWQDGKKPIAKQAKVGLSRAFEKFSEYQLSKYDGTRDEIKLRDVMFLTHPTPDSPEQASTWAKLANNTLPPADTWEVALSTGKDKKATWERLITSKSLGDLAFLRNLRNMDEAGVNPAIIAQGFSNLNGRWLLPINFYAAWKASPKWRGPIEAAMLQCYGKVDKLPGHSIFIVDVSGSMSSPVSDKSQFSRREVAASLAVLAKESCERVDIYCTAGSDRSSTHRTELLLKNLHGFDLVDVIDQKARTMGGGGIFTRQALEYVHSVTPGKVDRIMVFSDSQDCDRNNSIPNPWAENNYIIDISSHSHGVNYAGRWTAEISGWSEAFLTFIRYFEGIGTPISEDEE